MRAYSVRGSGRPAHVWLAHTQPNRGVPQADLHKKAPIALVWAHISPAGTFHIDINTHLDL
jgi:hypothetical protein